MRDTTVAVILGGSDFSKAELGSDEAFKLSADAFYRYLSDPDGFGLASDNLLNLFDDPRSPSDIDIHIEDFVRSRCSALKAQKKKIENLILYYTGHGHFTGPNAAYSLALPFTRDGNTASAYRVSDLAGTIHNAARGARRFIILDCCFAASAYSDFQSSVKDVMVKQAGDAFPRDGTSLLCASAPDRPAKSRTAAGRTTTGMTLFSECLLSVLEEGIARIDRPLLTLSDVGLAVDATIRERFHAEGPRPQVKSPRERSGDIAAVPLFPNSAWPRSAGEDRQAAAARSLKFSQPAVVASNDPVVVAVEESSDPIDERRLLGVERHVTVTLEPRQVGELEKIAEQLWQEDLDLGEVKALGAESWSVLERAQDWLRVVMENAKLSEHPQPIAWTGDGGLLARIYPAIQIACNDENANESGFVSISCGSHYFNPLPAQDMPRTMQRRRGALGKSSLAVEHQVIDDGCGDPLERLEKAAGAEIALIQTTISRPRLDGLADLVRGESAIRVAIGFGELAPSAEALDELLARLPAVALGGTRLATRDLTRALRRHLPKALRSQSLATALQPYRHTLCCFAHETGDVRMLRDALCWTTWSWVGRPLFATRFGETLPAAFPHLMNLRSIASKDWYFDRSAGIPPIYKAKSLIDSGDDPGQQFHLYLTGAGGTGKSCFLRYVYETLDVNQPQVLPVWYKVDAPSSEWEDVERRIKEEVRKALVRRFDASLADELIEPRKDLSFFLKGLVGALRARALGVSQVVLFIDQLERTFESGESPELYRLERIAKRFIELLEAVGVGAGVRVFIASRKQYLPDFLGSFQKASMNSLHFNVLQKISDDTEQVEFVQRVLNWCKERNLVDATVRLDEEASKELAAVGRGNPLETMLGLIQLFSQGSGRGQIAKDDIEKMRLQERLFYSDEQLAAKDEMDWYFFLGMAHARTEIVRFEEVWWRLRMVAPNLTRRVDELGRQGVLERMWLLGHLGRTLYARPLDDDPARYLEFFHANMRDHLIASVMNFGGDVIGRHGRKGGTPQAWRALDRLATAARDWKQSQQLLLREDVSVLMQHKQVFVEPVNKEGRAEQIEAFYLLFLRDNRNTRDDLCAAARECFVYSALVHDVLGRWAFQRLYPNLDDRVERCDAWLKRGDAGSRIRLLQYLVELRDVGANRLLSRLVIDGGDELGDVWRQLADILVEPLYATRYRRTFMRALVDYLLDSDAGFPSESEATKRFGAFVSASCGADREALLSLLEALITEDDALLEDDRIKMAVGRLIEAPTLVDDWLEQGARQGTDLSASSRQIHHLVPPRIELRAGAKLTDLCTDERLRRWQVRVAEQIGLPLPELILTAGELAGAGARAESDAATGCELELRVDGRSVALGDFYPEQVQTQRRHWDLEDLKWPSNARAAYNEGLEEAVLWVGTSVLDGLGWSHTSQDWDQAVEDWLHLTLRKNIRQVFRKYDLMPFLSSLAKEMGPGLDLRGLQRSLAGDFARLWDVLVNLVHEFVPIGNLRLLQELDDLVRSGEKQNSDFLIRKLRELAGQGICRVFADESNELHVLLMDSELERALIARLEIAERGPRLRLTADEGLRVVAAVRNAFETALRGGSQAASPGDDTLPVLVCDDGLRLPLFRLISRFDGRINVLGYTELSPEIRPIRAGFVSGVQIAEEP